MSKSRKIPAIEYLNMYRISLGGAMLFTAGASCAAHSLELEPSVLRDGVWALFGNLLFFGILVRGKRREHAAASVKV